jgi:hypothetical protein
MTETLIIAAHGDYWAKSLHAPQGVLSFVAQDGEEIFPVSGLMDRLPEVSKYGLSGQELQDYLSYGHVLIGDAEFEARGGIVTLTSLGEYRIEAGPKIRLAEDLQSAVEELDHLAAKATAYLGARLERGIDIALKDWRDDFQTTADIPDAMPAKLIVEENSIKLIEKNDGRQIWVEFEDGKIRVHGYENSNGKESPVNMDIAPSEISIDMEDYIQEERYDAFDDGP